MGDPYMNMILIREQSVDVRLRLDAVKDVIFMSQNVRNPVVERPDVADRFGPTDAQDVRHAISQMILTDARRGDSLGIQRKGNSTSSGAACRPYDFHLDLGAPSDR
jgi:hypothetical protein